MRPVCGPLGHDGRITPKKPAPTARPRHLRLCPVCCRRPEFLTADDCLICGGSGVLVLGALCLRFSPDVVARAVEYALDQAAQRAMAAGLDRAAARADVEQLLGDLQRQHRSRGEAQLLHQAITRE